MTIDRKIYLGNHFKFDLTPQVQHEENKILKYWRAEFRDPDGCVCGTMLTVKDGEVVRDEAQTPPVPKFGMTEIDKDEYGNIMARWHKEW